MPFENCPCGSLFRCRRQVLTPAFSDLVLILHPHPSITHTAAPARRSKHSVPCPMLTGAGLGLKGRLIGTGLKDPVTCTPSIRTTVLDAHLRLRLRSTIDPSALNSSIA